MTLSVRRLLPRASTRWQDAGALRVIVKCARSPALTERVTPSTERPGLIPESPAHCGAAIAGIKRAKGMLASRILKQACLMHLPPSVGFVASRPDSMQLATVADN